MNWGSEARQGSAMWREHAVAMRGRIAMRDPDLVLQAQQAAIALERAWHRWRVVHGLAADPMPPVSSYVGYSLEEPWGQPRVVFGLAAEEADQLAALLDRHDCVGPVHASVAPLPSLSGGVGSPSPSPLPVPAQAPPTAADQSFSRDVADDQDGPVYRQAAAAAHDAAAARQAAACETDGLRPAAVEAAGLGPATAQAAGLRPATAQAAGLRPAAAEAAGLRPATAQAAGTGLGTVPGTYPLPGEQSVPAQRTELDPAAGLGGRDDGGPVREGRPEPHPGQAAPGVAIVPGPLTQAASAARVVAEARIRAALQEVRPSLRLEDPYARTEADLTGPSQPAYADPADTRERAVVRAAGSRPEAASGALAWPIEAAPALHPSHAVQAGSTWADADPRDTAEVLQPAVVAFRPRADLAAYLDAGPESDRFFDGPDDTSAASFTRRGRMSRGHSIPRLPRAKRPGAAPGA
jgi:hypothetical protein